jgi:hypothetical protein
MDDTENKLYILRQNHKDGHDVLNSFIVRACSPSHARLLCAKCCGDEGESAWLMFSTWDELVPNGPHGVILGGWWGEILK